MIGRERIRRTLTVALDASQPPARTGIAFGVGVFIGCTPFFGFHSFIAAGAAALFRLNLLTVWLGTHISNPLLAGGLTLVSIGVGSYVLHETPSTVGRFSASWMVGSLIVGTVLGVTAGVLVTFAVRTIRARRNAAMPALPARSS